MDCGERGGEKKFENEERETLRLLGLYLNFGLMGRRGCAQ